MKTIVPVFCAALFFCGCRSMTPTEKLLRSGVNYDKSRIPAYTLPDPLSMCDGTPVKTEEEWQKSRRPELLALFQKYLYGKILPPPAKMEGRILAEKRGALLGKAIRREIELIFTGANGKTHSVTMLLYLPISAAQKPVPVFAGLSFGGIECCTPEPDVRTSAQKWQNKIKRGERTYRWNPELIVSRGYALALVCYHEFFPDRGDGWKESVLKLFCTEEELTPRSQEYTAIGCWSWGLRRMLDYLETLPEIDGKRMATIGHSRLGKTSLWTGAQDERVRLVCVNNAGCAGTAPSRRIYGETLYSMCHLRRRIGSWWLAPLATEYAVKPEKLPMDQHELIALVAPRAVVIHSALLDRWADPEGEYESAFAAGAVYRLFGREGLRSPVQPPCATPAGGEVSYYLRNGKHDLTGEDWQHYLAQADRFLK